MIGEGLDESLGAAPRSRVVDGRSDAEGSLAALRLAPPAHDPRPEHTAFVTGSVAHAGTAHDSPVHPG